MVALSAENQQRIRERLKNMENPVKLVHFTQALRCEACVPTRELLQELVQLSDKLSLEIFNFQLDKRKVAQSRIDKVPATLVEGAKGNGIRLYGLPAGYEFAVLLEDILAVSRGNSGLSPESVKRLRALTEPLHLEVFVTPTCPYCPASARLAHQLAIENELITADMVEATEFPDLVRRYKVRGVPKTVINGVAWIEGSLPEADYVDEIINGVTTRKESVTARR
jgi:glutaredoxin-like protein